MSVSAIVPMMSRPTFSPARMACRTVMFGFTCLTSWTLEEMDILTSIIAPTAPKIIPADRIPVKVPMMRGGGPPQCNSELKEPELLC